VTTFVALLRAVNLGGDTQVSMDELRDRLTRAGLQGVRTLLQSGNVVFRAPERDPVRVERTLNSTIAPGLGARTEFFVRTAPEWRAIVARNPFHEEAETDPGHLLVTVLKDAPRPEAWGALERAIVGRERVRGSGREAYVFYPDGVGRSKLTAKLLEKQLATSGTSRNWNTVRKLEAIVSG